MNIAILGCGTVGSSVLKILDEFGRQSGIEVQYILTRQQRADLDKRQTQSLETILSDPRVDAVVETIGGLEPALTYITRAMQAGKAVVTANKQVVCQCLEALHECAEKNHVEFLYGASVGGGIPWLHNLMRTARIDRIVKIEGILNGTCNYILDAMTRKAMAFEDAVKNAQALGYAEADPSADLNGLDARRKCAISASLAFGQRVREDAVVTRGITGIREEDVAFFKENHWVCRLMVQAVQSRQGIISASVEPMLFPEDSLPASILENQNLARLLGEASGWLSFSGQGAGGIPTAMTVIQDLTDLKQGIWQQTKPAIAATVDNGLEKRTYYLRDRRGKRWIEKMSLQEMEDMARKYAEDQGWFAAALAEGAKSSC